jgi:hypothetical protein
MNLTKSQQQKAILSYKEDLQNDDFSVEYDILQPYDPIDYSDSKRKEIYNSISNIDKMSKELEDKIFELNNDIDKLTNHADGFDYTIAVATGVLCGLIDSFVIGEFDFKTAKAKGHRQVNNFIMTFAKLKGFDGERLNEAIEFLEKKYPIPNDKFISSTMKIGRTNHHLADLAHHPTPLGLACSILSQLSGYGFFVDRDGKWHFPHENVDSKKFLEVVLSLIISGILLWLVNMVESKYVDKLDKTIPKPIRSLIKILATTPALIPIFKAAEKWIGHLVSDMGGSKNTAGGGMGIPGVFLSFLHEISSLPYLKDTSLPRIVNDLYVKKDIKFNLRSEVAFLNEFSRQAIPVILGDVLVRTFYFVRHLIKEYKQSKDLKLINWHNVVPFNNRTIVRMMTIESGTFTVIDLADATLRTAIKNGTPHNPLFWKGLILRVNFVGIGRFAIAFGTDIGMGIKRQSLIKERLQYKAEKNMLYVAKIYYLQEDMWIEASDTEKAINNMCSIMKKSMIYFNESWKEISKNLEEIQKLDINEIERKNPNLINDLTNILD